MSFRASLEEVIDKDRSGLLTIPPHWARVRIGDVASIQNGFAFNSKGFQEGAGFPLIRIRDIRKVSTEVGFIGGYDDQYVVQPGDLLVGMDGDFNVAMWMGRQGLLNQRVCRITPNEAYYDRRFLFYALPGYLAAINAHTSSVTVKHLSSRTVADIPLPLPNSSEQRRIVAKLDELFSELDAGVAALERAQAKLKRYRASVLKAAVEGRLTEEWRRKNPPDETGAELLQRILVERRKRWEQEQLAKFTAKGQKPTKNWQQKYRDPVAPETRGLPELPDGWCWASFDSICHLQLGKMLSREARESTENRRPYLRNSNVRWFSIDLSYLKQMAFRDHELEKFSVRSGDLLICEGGEPGRCAIYTGSDHTLMYQKAIHRARPHLASVSMRFVQFCFAHQVSSGIGMPRYSETTIRHLTLEKLRAIPLPIAPLSEQDEMAGRATFQLNCLDNVQQVLDALPASHQTVRQSILKRAFEGRLVPQDPHDEPASILLERIWTEAADKKKRMRRPTKPNGKRRTQVP